MNNIGMMNSYNMPNYNHNMMYGGMNNYNMQMMNDMVCMSMMNMQMMNNTQTNNNMMILIKINSLI